MVFTVFILCIFVTKGDSGGPLVYKNRDDDGIFELVGIQSTRNGCDTGYPTAVTRITYYLDCIKAWLEKYD